MTMKVVLLLSLLLIGETSSFTSILKQTVVRTSDAAAVGQPECSAAQAFPRLSPLFMGRAAAVREKTKSKTDAKKAKTNALFGKKLIQAVKAGGSPDPNANRALAELIRLAKNANVPVDNITRAIKRASEKSVGDFKDGVFEAYGTGGVSFVINVLTDNSNRATSNVNLAVGKLKGKMAETGSVLFMYDRRGRVDVKGEPDEEAVLEAAIEAGCDDYEMIPGDEAGTTIIYTDPKEVSIMLEAVRTLGFDDKALALSLCYVSKAPVEVSDEDFEFNMLIIDALEELDDVDTVEHNMSN
jgi:YebC/PmpR family DNA-binding regulatory protein